MNRFSTVIKSTILIVEKQVSHIKHLPQSAPLHTSWEGTVLCLLWAPAVHYFWYTLLSPSWGMWRSAPESTGLEAVAQRWALLQPKCLLLLTIIIQTKSLLQPLATTSDLLSTLFQTYSTVAYKLQLQEGLIHRRWLASVPFVADSALPDNSFTAQWPWHWWQQLSPSYRIIADRRNASKPHACWAWRYS